MMRMIVAAVVLLTPTAESMSSASPEQPVLQYATGVALQQ
jgi:hypothetical protein